MNRLQATPFALLSLFSALCTALPTQAIELDRVEVSGKALRLDVARTCPKLQEQIEQGLRSAMGNPDLEGNYRIEFMLQGQAVSEVSARSVVGMKARQAVRAAMRQVDCVDFSTAANPQRFAFGLSVRLDDAGPATSPRSARLQLLELSRAAAAR